MKKLSLVILFSFLIVFVLLLIMQKKKPAPQAAFLKKVSNTQLKESKSLQTGESSYRMYLYGDSLYLLSEARNIIAIDTGLHGISRYPYPFDLGSNAVWYFNKTGQTNSYLSYPDGSIVQTSNTTFNRFTQNTPINNCVNTGHIFWGQTSDASDTRSFITYFDLNSKSTSQRYDLFEAFSNVKGFSADCFTTSIDGTFIKISDTAFLFYNYYSSYFVWFNNDGYKIYSGIDSFPLRTFRKIKTTAGDYEVEKCVSENESFVHLSGCSDGRYVYMLSNVTSRRLNNHLAMDVYRADDMQYAASYIIPTRNNSKPTDIVTAPGSGCLYVLYGDNSLVKFNKPL